VPERAWGFKSPLGHRVDPHDTGPLAQAHPPPVGAAGTEGSRRVADEQNEERRRRHDPVLQGIPTRGRSVALPRHRAVHRHGDRAGDGCSKNLIVWLASDPDLVTAVIMREVIPR
jgi:hypothetical protein